MKLKARWNPMNIRFPQYERERERARESKKKRLEEKVLEKTKKEEKWKIKRKDCVRVRMNVLIYPPATSYDKRRGGLAQVTIAYCHDHKWLAEGDLVGSY
uniref:Uncharacterized protein n=1 Tax=Caenorhabditis japonica TaxID=281687 RepID=A0A8R1IHE5_CAEJA